MIVSFRITKADIEKGKREDCALCPAALAVRRKLPRFRVASDTAFRGDTGKNVHYETPLPKKVRHFINEFDNGRPVKPLTFSIRIKRKVFEKEKRK
jgi:hypothetical protein